MKIAVTGSAGFIGTAVLRELADRGHETIGLDRRTGADILSADIGDMMLGADGVIHLAGALGTAELFDQPRHGVEVNVVGTANVLAACAANDIAFVGITMPQVWDSLYQATKAGAMAIAKAYHVHRGVAVSHVRAFNVYGPHQAVGPGHPQKILPTFATRAWEGSDIPVWGSGSQVVDLVHVDDVARMLVSALNFGDLEVFDAGTGTAMTVNEVAEVVVSETGGRSRVTHLPMRLGELPDTGVVAEGLGWGQLGWRPQADEGLLRETIRWYAPDHERLTA